MRSLVLIFISLGMPALIAAAPVIIRGDAQGYAGKRIAVMTCEDEFSGKRILLQSTEVSESGSFSLAFELQETRRVFLNINRVEAVMYAEPDGDYDVLFPADATASIRRFDKTELELEFRNLPADDLNNLIRNFNTDFSEFVGNHYYDFAIGEYAQAATWLKSRGMTKSKVDLYKSSAASDSSVAKPQPEFNKFLIEFKKDIDTKYPQPRSTFFDDYLNYSLAELDVLAGMNRRRFYARYFMSRELPLKNPAFVTTFSLFYKGMLASNTREIQNRIIKAINVNKNPDEIIAIFDNDSTCLSSAVRTLMIINGLKELYNDKTYARRSVEKTLENIKSGNEHLVLVARNTMMELQKRREDFPMENFVCLDGKMDKWQLFDHNDHHLYILFFATWSAPSVKELQVMQKWHEKYAKYIEFVAICMDDDFAQYKEFLASHRDLKFEILFGNADPLLVDKAMVYAIPEAVMLNEYGRTAYAHTRKPSEGIQLDFDKIMLMMEQKPGGPKTWKD